MNKWSAIVLVVVILLFGFIYVSDFEDASLSQFTSFFGEVVLAIFGVTVLVIVVNVIRRR